MPTITTRNLINIPIQGIRPYVQVIVKVINNNTSSGLCYLKGLVNNGSQQAAFAEDLFFLYAEEVINRTYEVGYDNFQINAVYSTIGLEFSFYGVDAEGLYTPIETEEVNISRITSEIRSVKSITQVDNYAVMSFRKNLSFTNPNGVAASVYIEGLDILTRNPIRYTLVQGGTTDGSFNRYPTPTTQIPAEETALEVNTTCTVVTNGRVVTQGTMTGIAGAFTNTSVSLMEEGVMLDLEDGDNLTLVIDSLMEDIDVVVTLRMLEQW
ncbi:hypothetical protein [Paenibacillus gallinarum]|uniref:Uncharacterized protein n=1 Tax=Paenibacillus gallinarum TaxID=2762232 RepID=A0ABR8T2J1_9BACL|nr:hypothetical protein [Paenibacillus gallinarum]MBD7969969.1 hypothetical protein [Paenibacillus gallinarum]